MKKTISIALFAVMGLAVGSSCKKDDDKKAADPKAETAEKVTTPTTETPPATEVKAPVEVAKASHPDVLGHLPADTEVVISLSFTTLATTPLWNQYSAMAMDSMSKELTEIKETCGFDPMTTLNSVVVGVNSSRDEEPVVIISGFERKGLTECFKSMAEKEKEKLSITEDGAITIIKGSKKKGKNQTIGWINDTTMIMVPKKNDKKWIEARIAKTDGLDTSKGFASIADSANKGEPVWFAVRAKEGSPMAKGLASMTMGSNPLGAYGSVGFNDGLQLNVGARFADAKAATSLLEQVKPMIGMLKPQLGPAASMLDKLVLATADADLTLNLNLSSGDLEHISKMAAPMMMGK